MDDFLVIAILLLKVRKTSNHIHHISYIIHRMSCTYMISQLSHKIFMYNSKYTFNRHQPTQNGLGSLRKLTQSEKCERVLCLLLTILKVFAVWKQLKGSFKKIYTSEGLGHRIGHWSMFATSEVLYTLHKRMDKDMEK